MPVESSRRRGGPPPVPHFVALLSVLRRAAARGLHLLPDGPPPGRGRRLPAGPRPAPAG